VSAEQGTLQQAKIRGEALAQRALHAASLIARADVVAHADQLVHKLRRRESAAVSRPAVAAHLSVAAWLGLKSA
jgi:hypothetical protein